MSKVINGQAHRALSQTGPIYVTIYLPQNTYLNGPSWSARIASLKAAVLESATIMVTRQSEIIQSDSTGEERQDVDLSLIIPVLNEVDNLRPLIEEIVSALANEGWSYEVIFIDDGSADGSFAVMRDLHDSHPHVGAIRFRRNYGQTAAFAAGFDHARGRLIVTMDADRQNDPADIPTLIEQLAEGNDVVNGWRVNRKDGFLLRRLPSMVANRLIARLTGVRLHDRGCSLRVFRAEVVRELQLYGEMHRFIPELATSAGFVMAEVPVNHRPRQAGKTKYGLSRTFRVILDLMTIIFLRRYSARPMHLFGGLGILGGGLGFLIALYLTGLKLWAGIREGVDGFQRMRIGDRPLLSLAILLIILGVQFLLMGLLAELVVRTYHESQNKPVYYVGEVIEPGIGSGERGEER